MAIVDHMAILSALGDLDTLGAEISGTPPSACPEDTPITQVLQRIILEIQKGLGLSCPTCESVGKTSITEVDPTGFREKTNLTIIHSRGTRLRREDLPASPAEDTHFFRCSNGHRWEMKWDGQVVWIHP